MLGDLLTLFAQPLNAFHELGDKEMNPLRFGSDLVDTRTGLIPKSGFESRITFG